MGDYSASFVPLSSADLQEDATTEKIESMIDWFNKPTAKKKVYHERKGRRNGQEMVLWSLLRLASRSARCHKLCGCQAGTD